MIKKELITEMKGSEKYIAYSVLWQWLALVCQIVAVVILAVTINKSWDDNLVAKDVWMCVGVTAAMIVVKFFCDKQNSKANYKAGYDVKKKLRKSIYDKVLSLGAGYREKTSTSEVIQLTVEGIEQLEIYYGKYLPQLFYSVIAPVTLFAFLSFISFKVALVLLICVPLIPISIVLVQKIAKRLLNNYWGVYTELGDSFLENLQGLTTLKIYKSDEFKAKQMEEEAEKFRKITMRVLIMQLNSISVMDLVAYGGAAIGMVMAIFQFQSGNLRLWEAITIALLAAEFFIPLRLLGSFFHIAMNGMAASDKIFAFLKTESGQGGTEKLENEDINIEVENLTFGYDENTKVLNDVSLEIKSGQFVSVVGVSGSGKSTIASLITGNYSNFDGTVKINGNPIENIDEKQLMNSIVTVRYNSYIFGGTVRENLKMAKENGTDEEFINILKKVNLWEFLQQQRGLDTKLTEQGSNLSGGQKQRMALARAILKDAPMYIFDEATSNIDVESESLIMEIIKELAKEKTILFISHRMANVVDSDNIYVLKDGGIAEQGVHEELMENKGMYFHIYTEQEKLCNKWGDRHEA